MNVIGTLSVLDVYFGGIWGGQLQRWRKGYYDVNGTEPEKSEPAMGPRVARLSNNMLSFDEEVKEITIMDKNRKPLLAGDHDQRFFEAS